MQIELHEIHLTLFFFGPPITLFRQADNILCSVMACCCKGNDGITYTASVEVIDGIVQI